MSTSPSTPTPGVLRLPEEVLFDKGSDAVKPEGVHVLALVGQAMQADLPCYAASPQPKGCPATASGLESVFVEGHTDADQMVGARATTGTCRRTGR